MAPSSSTGNAAFAQQGTLDWTALSRSSFTFSVEVMSRFSKAGVEMITCAMSQAMYAHFNVPPEGQKRVTDAISKLKAYSSYGQVLWFGFGVKHIVRSLCETKQGATCAALCAYLRVSYSTEMSARVLSVLCDQLLPSAGLSPALPQWAALIDVCSGALSPSKFPTMVDGFCRLAFADPQPHLHYHKATTVDALAYALVELSKVSSGSVSSITFEGGYDCGWIAAVAEWLLCLKVKVLTEDGNCLYWQDSSHTNGSAQVIIIFNTRSHTPDLAETKELRVVNRTVRLPCNGKVKFFRRSGDEDGELFGMGRSSWSTILGDTFGSTFKLLLSPNIIEHLAKLLLSGATAPHSFGCLAFSNRFRSELMHPWMRSFSSPAASGERTFFLALANRLPELTPLLDALGHLERSTSASAGPEGSQLWNFCDCDSCSRGTARMPTTIVTTKICLHQLGLTLMTLIWLLPRINVDETIQPAPSGLLMLYNDVMTHVSDYHFKSKHPFFPNKILCERIGWHADLDTNYRRILELFTGLPCRKSICKFGAASAICHGGVCIWLPALKNPLYYPHKQMRLRVTPGSVSFRDRLYRKVVDMEESEISAYSASIMPWIAAHGTSRVSTLIIRETWDASQLEACIELSSGKTSSAFNTYLNHLEVERPRLLPSELRLQIRKLYGTLLHRIIYGTCAVDLGRARFQGRSKPDLTTWERPCPSLALRLESTTSPKRSYNYPEAGEWVVVVADMNGVVPRLQCIRGDFSLLYYLMSLEFSDSLEPAYLLSFDGCIRCLAHEFCFNKARYYGSSQIDIHTISDNECKHWSARMGGNLPEDQSDPHPVLNSDTRYQLDETAASTSSLDDDILEGDSTTTR